MIPLNQRDNRWSRIQLGSSNTTIGSHGCTITCIAMLVGTTPDVVNRELKRVGGFALGNLVIWSKVPQAFPQLEFVKRVNYYNNNDVKNNLPCLVEVDFDGSPRTFGNHWVVFIGNQRLLDPWTGQNRPTRVYSILKGYAIFKKKIEIEEQTTATAEGAPADQATDIPPETSPPDIQEPSDNSPASDSTGGSTVISTGDNTGPAFTGSDSSTAFPQVDYQTDQKNNPLKTLLTLFINFLKRIFK